MIHKIKPSFYSKGFKLIYNRFSHSGWRVRIFSKKEIGQKVRAKTSMLIYKAPAWEGRL